MNFIKNIPLKEIQDLDKQIDIKPGQIISKTLIQNTNHSMTLFGIAKGEEISTHHSSGDAFVYLLKGQGQFVIDGIKYNLNEGQSIIMPKDVPHSVFGINDFKFLLIVFFN